MVQLALFYQPGLAPGSLPEGAAYEPGFLDPVEEQSLVELIESITFRTLRGQGGRSAIAPRVR